MPQPQINRHKTAIVRPGLSRPVQTALADGVISHQTTVFDYGCGKGRDLELLRSSEIDCEGWDPVHRPATRPSSADVVNLGYVVNIIEDPKERADSLKRAWDLTGQCLVVSTRLNNEARGLKAKAFGDGCITGAGTFQKFYDQGEFRDWLDAALNVQSVAAAPGIFYVFRDPAQREEYVSTRYRRKSAMPRLRKSDVLFEQHSGLLKPLMEFFTDRGRLPRELELPKKRAIEEAFNSIRRAWRVVLTVTGKEDWAGITEGKMEDLLIYLALARFGGRPKFSRLAPALQGDVKAFFSTYKRACEHADELLFSAGDMTIIDRAMNASPVGKRTGNALYIHASAIDSLPVVLRVYEGCASSYLGAVDGANIIKLSRYRPKVSYLSYPEFDKVGHPVLAEALILKLADQHLYYRDYRDSESPPLLHRKELFVSPDYPLHTVFDRLTQREEALGLFSVDGSIGTANGWYERLRGLGLEIRGHRVFRRSDN